MRLSRGHMELPTRWRPSTVKKARFLTGLPSPLRILAIPLAFLLALSLFLLLLWVCFLASLLFYLASLRALWRVRGSSEDKALEAKYRIKEEDEP